MRFLVTGGAGFIGSAFCRLLSSQYPDIVFDIVDDLSTGRMSNLLESGVTYRSFFQMSIREFLKEHSLRYYDGIFHFAALPRIQPAYTEILLHHDANVVQSILLLERLVEEQHWECKFIYSGSSAIYGNPKRFPTPETTPPDPLSVYGFQKLEVERYLELLSVRYPLKWVILRYFNPYGLNSYNPENKYSAYSSVIGIFEDRITRGLPLQITGNGRQSRDFVSVEDVARANFLAFTKYKGNATYNVGTGRTISINQLADYFEAEREYVPEREGEAIVTLADNRKIMQDFGICFRNVEEYILEKRGA